MKGALSLCLVIAGLAQFFIIGYNIYTLMLLIFLCFLAGLIGGLDNKPRNARLLDDSANLATLAQIERIRYFRNQNKE